LDGGKHQIRDEYARRNVELVNENERLSMENKRLKEELDQGTCVKLQEYNARITEMEHNLAVVKQRRDGLKAKFEYVSLTVLAMLMTMMSIGFRFANAFVDCAAFLYRKRVFTSPLRSLPRTDVKDQKVETSHFSAGAVFLSIIQVFK